MSSLPTITVFCGAAVEMLLVPKYALPEPSRLSEKLDDGGLVFNFAGLPIVMRISLPGATIVEFGPIVMLPLVVLLFLRPRSPAPEVKAVLEPIVNVVP